VQWGQGRITIGIGQVGESCFFNEGAFSGQDFHDPLDDSCEYPLELLSAGSWGGLENLRAVSYAIDSIQHQTEILFSDHVKNRMKMKKGLIARGKLWAYQILEFLPTQLVHHVHETLHGMDYFALCRPIQE